jgi:hypothetical protein
MLRHASMLCTFLTLFVTAAGCGRQASLNIEKDIELDGLGGDNIKSTIVSAAQKEQKVSILVRTNAVPVNVFVVLEKDVDVLRGQLENDQTPTVNIIAKKEKLQEGTVEATIPAGSGFAVVLTNRGSKKAEVMLKIGTSK